MATADLQGPLDDFLRRTKEMRQVMGSIEVVSRGGATLTSPRPDIDLSLIDASTSNTANSMSLIFLAAAFEEFVREEVSQCGQELMSAFGRFPSASQSKIREKYWEASRDGLRYSKIRTGSAIDAVLASKLGTALTSIHGFVVNGDPATLAPGAFSHHSNNFRINVVEEILGRLGINKLVESLADNHKLKTHFGVTKKADCLSHIQATWEDFYVRRNETVHSLGGSAGFAVDAVNRYIVFLELIAEAMVLKLQAAIAAW